MYTVVEGKSSKILIVPAKERYKWRFYRSVQQMRKGVQVKLMDLGDELILEYKGTVLVYKIPSINDYHFEVLRQSKLAGFLSKPTNYCPEKQPNGVQEMVADHEALLENMVEFQEKI